MFDIRSMRGVKGESVSKGGEGKKKDGQVSLLVCQGSKREEEVADVESGEKEKEWEQKREVNKDGREGNKKRTNNADQKKNDPKINKIFIH